jgi:filamentous hemagglutinin family protein
MLKNWLIASLGILELFSCAMPALAQSVPSNIVPDSTLGNQRSIVDRINTLESIRGGSQRGQNLFHSFSEFNVGDGQRLYFANPTSVQNILTRVTGTSASNILGTLGVDGNANLFLINPNGILFGTNAQLDVRGSFVGTTANGIGFGTQGVFNATNPNAPPLLTVNPSAFLFNQINPGKIISRSIAPVKVTTDSSRIDGLRVPDGQSLVLVGGDIEINGGGNREGLMAQNGRIELGGLAAPGAIGLSQENNLMKLSFPVGITRSNVTITNGASVFVGGNQGGSIAVNAQNLNVLNGSDITGGIFTGSTGNRAGDIEINLLGNLEVGGNKPSFIDNQVLKNITGSAGNITIKTDSIRVTGGSQIFSATKGFGNAGDITINANNFLVSGESPNASASSLPNPSGVFSQTEASATGKAGNLTLNTKILNVSNGGKVQAATFGNGDSGTLFIKANEINVFNDLGISPVFDTQINTGVSFDPFRNVDSAGQTILAKGNGGKMTIETGRLSIRNGGSVSSDTRGIGNAGNLSIKASDIEVSGRSGISADTYEIGKGNAGDLTITTNRLRIVDGAQISSSTLGQGNAGKLTINATTSVEIDRESPRTNNSAPVPTGLFAQVEATATGNAGDLTLTTNKLSVSNGGKIQAATFGKGNGGDLVIKADEIDVFNSPNVNPGQLTNINAGVGFDRDRNIDSKGNPIFAVGKGGNLKIETRRLSLNNGVSITSDTISGQGGNIDLKVSDYLLIRKNSDISASAGTAQLGGDGGNIKIDTQFVIATPRGNNDITANAYTGKGGNIQIKAQSILGLQARAQRTRQTNDITASSQLGTNGTVTLNTPDLDPSRGLSVLPTTTTDPTNQINPNCSAKAIANNSFTSVGRGGIPATPKDPLNEQEIATNWVRLNPQEAVPSTPIAITPAQLPHPIVEAQGWRRERNGDVILVTRSSLRTLPRSAQPQSGCVR